MRSLRANVALGFVVALGLVGGPIVARAQGLHPGDPSHPERTFGPIGLTSHTIAALTFTANDGLDSPLLRTNFKASRYCTAPCALMAPVHLPAGARVISIELGACDTSGTGFVAMTLFRIPDLEVGNATLATAITGGAEVPGCGFFTQVLPIPETVDNFNNAYFVSVSINGTDELTRFWAVRIYYRLQVSPAPAVATFNDVPTSHVFFQWIEALARAGITTGCSAAPPLYCPDDFVTRGQMAVFISKALGLHFSP